MSFYTYKDTILFVEVKLICIFFILLYIARDVMNYDPATRNSMLSWCNSCRK